ncbi:MAG: cupin domain-containing protein [Gemmataceae bacterium]
MRNHEEPIDELHAALLPEDESSLDANNRKNAYIAYELISSRLFSHVEAVEPPSNIKKKLMQKISPPNNDTLICHPKEYEFQPTRLPGVTYRILHRDKSRNKFSALVRMAPGTSLRSHEHSSDSEPEECIVLEGELMVGDVKMSKGDYQRCEPGSHHQVQSTQTGALLYFSASIDFLKSV